MKRKTKTEVLHIRLSKAEKESLKQSAIDSNMTLTDLVKLQLPINTKSK